MDSSITIREQRHSIWKTGTCIAGGLTILFGLIYWNLSDPLWAGIFRLIAFIFFSLTIFGALKLIGDPLTVTINSTPDRLSIGYKQKEKTVREDQFKPSDIQDFIITTDEQSFWRRYLHPGSATLKIRFNDDQHDLHLFEYSGRILFFEETAIQEVYAFLNKQHVPGQSQK